MIFQEINILIPRNQYSNQRSPYREDTRRNQYSNQRNPSRNNYDSNIKNINKSSDDFQFESNDLLDDFKKR